MARRGSLKLVSFDVGELSKSTAYQRGTLQRVYIFDLSPQYDPQGVVQFHENITGTSFPITARPFSFNM
jgi:hypothetical protein